MNQTALLSIAVAAGFAGGFIGSVLFAPTSPGSADDAGETTLYAREAEVRDLTDRVVAVETATNAHDLSLGILGGRYEDLAARVPSTGPPGPEGYGPGGEMLLADGDLPTGPAFDNMVNAVIEQREEAEQAEREAQRAERRQEQLQRRVDRLAEEMGLNGGQKDQLMKALQESTDRRDQVFADMRESGTWDREAARTVMSDLRTAETNSLSTFLTEEQVSTVQASGGMDFGRGGRGGGGGGTGGGGTGGGGNRGGGF